VSASVAAEIMNVLPNGNLEIRARKSIRVNTEEQKIELTGVIRPADITPQNTVASSVIADARILVNGEDRFTNAETPGLLERAFSFLKDVLF
jgi:flagellar L-ring protein precursor FlgH